MIPDQIVMVRPAAFGFNAETAVNNAFQNVDQNNSSEQIQAMALREFDEMVALLRSHGIQVYVFEDHADDRTPDSIFPNNWISTFGPEIILYSMFAPNRRRERKEAIYTQIAELTNKRINTDLLSLEKQGKILEGTGSLVCDYQDKVAFAALSDRTHPEALDRFASISGYRTVRFKAFGPDGQPIYHTNVMMCVADQYVVIGLDTIDPADRMRVKQAIDSLGKEIIEIDNQQVFSDFAGNMLQLSNAHGEVFIVMSERAKNNLTPHQLQQFHKFNNTIISPSIPTIENTGGGSVRCMMAELFPYE